MHIALFCLVIGNPCGNGVPKKLDLRYLIRFLFFFHLFRKASAEICRCPGNENLIPQSENKGGGRGRRDDHCADMSAFYR